MKSVWFMMLASVVLGSTIAEGRSLQDAAVSQGAPPPITDGAAAFKVRGCAQCHAINGAGGHKGPDLSGVGRRLKKEAIEVQIVKGGDAMPAFGDVLQHDEIAALVVYLRKQKSKIPPYAKAAAPAQADSPGTPD